jgi:hypothetical protein
MTQMPPSYPPVEPPMPAGGSPMSPLAPHRGTTVLVLGIIGLVCCMVCGIIAWVLGHNDIKEMDAGRMDPAGRGTTQAGMICGIISVGLYVLGMIGWVLMMILSVSFRSCRFH